MAARDAEGLPIGVVEVFGEENDLADVGAVLSLCGFVNRLMVQPQKLIDPQGDRRVGLALIVAELHFVDSRGPDLNNRANLATDQPLVWQVCHQHDHGMKLKLAQGKFLSTLHKMLSAAASPRQSGRSRHCEFGRLDLCAGNRNR